MSQLIEISGCNNDDRKADVVFVHGLGGDASITWRHGKDDSTSWPHWLGEDFSEIGIWALNYAASPSRLLKMIRLVGFGSRDSGHSMALTDRAQQVLDLLRQKGLGQRPIMFICHSLGGLLVKQLLRKSKDSVDLRMQNVALNTRAVLFLATPHSGASLATFLNYFRKIFGSTVSIENLREHDAHLRDLYEWYRNHAPRLGIETVTYYELRKYKGVLIVTPTSSHPGIGNDPVGLDENHLSISKPRTRNAQVYVAASDVLQKRVLISQNVSQTIPANEIDDDTESISSNQSGQLIDTVQRQARTIDLLLRRDALMNLEHSSQTTKSTETDYMQNGGTYLGDSPLIAFQSSRKEVAISSDNFSKIIESLKTADDIATEIRSQHAIWNNDVAFILAERLEDHLKDIDESTNPRLLDYLFLMARAHVRHAEKNNSVSKTHIEKANKFLDQIDARIGGSPRAGIVADVYALKGLILALEKGPDAALRSLENCNDQYAIRIRLAMYLKKKDIESAVTLIKDIPPDLEWCELGVTALASSGRRDDAIEIVQWASKQEDRIKYRQCVVCLADTSLALVLTNQKHEENIKPQLHQVLEDINPIVSPIITIGSVDSELDTCAVKVAWQTHVLLGHRAEVEELAQLMSTRTPVPTEVARTVISGYLSPPPDLPRRLRKDYPCDLDAKILAAVVESYTGQNISAFEEAKKLLPLADTAWKKEELFMLFQHLCQNLGKDEASECENIAFSLVEHHPQLQAMFTADRMLNAGHGAQALEILDKQRAEDDMYWLQLQGNALMKQGRLEEAVDILLLAAHQGYDPRLIHKVADLAVEANKIDIAIECYESLISIRPDNLIARGNLASLYLFHKHDISKAVIQFQALHESEPENSDYTINLAACLSQLYRAHESLALYDEVCNAEHPNLRAVLGRAELLSCLGKSDEACASLKNFREVFWDNPDFLLACMNIAYAAGDEDFVHEVLTKLNEIRATESLDENMFRMVHTDEAIQIFKESYQAAEDKRQYLHTEMLKGRMPWIWVAQLSGDAVYWAWRIRTQELSWFGDDPINRAGYTIYATNGFHPGEQEDGRRALLPLECPASGTPVVADLSALISLHRLGLLEQSADYFGEILIPEPYLATALEDGKKMVLHQRSRQRTAERINHLLAAGTIAIVDQVDSTKDSIVFADEYQDTDTHLYRLIDVLKPVYEAGAIDDAAYERICKVCTKPSSVDAEHVSLTRFQNVHIGLLTLETLTSFGHLDVVARFFHIFITDKDRVELRQRLDTLHVQEETRGWHFDLWDRLTNDSRFKFIAPILPEELKDKDSDNKDFLAFSASFIAQEQGIPLLADDRVCLAMTLNNQQALPSAAFGSDAVVLALAASGGIDASGAAKAILTLMEWRYRFIVPSVSILKTCAAQFRGNLPGMPLRDIAEYIHDCMRDSGLFGGAENTDLKESMAQQLYISWVGVLAEWLVRLWVDDDFSEENARYLTEWCVQECLPSAPRVMHGSVKIATGISTNKLLIAKMLLKTMDEAGNESISNAMKAIHEALELTADEYQRIVTEVLNGTAKVEF